MRRDGAAVRVVCAGEVRRATVAQLQEVLLDLTDGQGNLSVEVWLPDVAVIDLTLLDVLVDAECRLMAYGGRLSVVTKIGSWQPGVGQPGESAAAGGW